MSKESSLLIDEYPLIILPTLAKAIGLNEAVVLQQIHYWLETFKRAGKAEHRKYGKWWVYNTYEQWQADNFPFWSTSTVRRIVESLEERGLLVGKQLEKQEWKRRKWYTIDYKRLKELEQTLRTAQNEQIDHSQNEQIDPPQVDQINTETTQETTTDSPAAVASEPRYAVGDRVCHVLSQECGTVVSVDTSAEPRSVYYVEWDTWGMLMHQENSLLPAPPDDPPTPPDAPANAPVELEEEDAPPKKGAGKPKTPRPPDPLFDAILARSFRGVVRGHGSRIGLIKKAILAEGHTLELYNKACDFYEEKQLTVARGEGTVIDMINDYLEEHKATPPLKTYAVCRAERPTREGVAA